MRGEEQEDPLRLVTSLVRKELDRKSYAMLCVCLQQAKISGHTRTMWAATV